MAEVQLQSPYNIVTKRDGSSVSVENLDRRVPPGFDIFTANNAGFRLASFQNTKFEGDNVIGDISNAFPKLALIDFEERPESSISLSGSRFNITNSARIIGVTLSASNQTISTDPDQLSTISVLNTDKFFDTGYLLTEKRSVIRYLSKTSNSFSGYIISGTDALESDDEIIQHSFL
ncbi:virion structural protein [Synechococcus phage S-PM2]|uniref:Virion structural protein n=1 Tax=Synechococcus phage S-PM2 TaxID=238854 RepID=Q5GQT8_BPSYP|nr:virion structural protein [Synechococcus phage S-PM2]CAF34146.1 virion structural protein [Synechococcus phage S-PM2]CFW42212.1 virion structural protein [Synechococcus phage S-PM2]